MEFYTYLWLRYDGTPYYVGKGKGKRAWRHLTYPYPPQDVSRILVEYHDSEQNALFVEKYLIAFWGRKDLGTGILLNRTDGGEGIPTLSPETRVKMSENGLLGRTSKQRSDALRNTLAKMTPEQRSENARKAGRASQLARTDEQRREFGIKWGQVNRDTRTPEQWDEFRRKGLAARRASSTAEKN
jgi:hypothetical protein